MATFGDLQRDAIAGTIATFDRLIFKGHLNALFPRGAFKCSGARRQESGELP
jgi:hypothetical protein